MQGEKIQCVCGGKYTLANKCHHFETKKHKDYVRYDDTYENEDRRIKLEAMQEAQKEYNVETRRIERFEAGEEEPTEDIWIIDSE